MQFRYALKKMDVIEAPSVEEANVAIKRIASEYGAEIALPATAYDPMTDVRTFGIAGSVRKMIERRIATGDATQEESEAMKKFMTTGHF